MLGEAIVMRRQKGFGRCTGVIAGAIVDQKQVLSRLLQDHLHKPLVTFRVKPALNALREQTPGEIFNRAKDFVAFALAAGRHFRLPATAGPRITQGAPLGKAGLILK